LPTPGKKLRVAIAGGGVGGLTTALCMLKEGFDVTVFEKTGKFARFGGPIQFASNATSTLKAIDERLFQRVMDKFTFTATRRCGIKDGKRADGSFRMTEVLDPSYLVDSNVPADWFVSFPLKECADFFQLPYTGVINRPDLQDILLDECQRLKPDFIRNGAAVEGYENHAGGVTVKLSDGSTAEADVLVGSDGIWSSVRAQMYNEGEVKAQSVDGLTRQGCPYSGYTVFAGETVKKLGDYYECGYKVYIGPQRYFVTSDVGDGRIQWYAFLALPPGTKKAEDTWEGSGSSAGQGQDVIEWLKSLHEGWSSEVFQVLEATPAESVEQRDLYDRWPEFFRSWADGSTILVGDAVHPMMPNLGQGGCQAIEDAYELTRALKALTTYSGSGVEPEAVAEALEGFYRRRMPRVAGISLLSRLASDLIINAFDTPWSPHDSKGTDWKSYLTFAWKPLLQYVVFPAQFLFLYSYHPSGPMGDLPKKLEADWRKRHEESAEAAFKRAEEEGQTISVPSFFAKVNA
jgi:zeaxanthin epoxidase